MDIKLLKEMIELLENSSLEQIKVKTQDYKVELKKPSLVINQEMYLPENKTSEVKLTNEVVVDKNYFKAPIVGSVYLKPSPEAEDFIKVGQTVKKGDTLCIIEAMKIMNEIKADQDGIVKEILVKNGNMVQYDQNLFVIE